MSTIIYFHRNKRAGFSINKVTQTIISKIEDKEEYYMPCKGGSLKSVLGNLWCVIKNRKRRCIHHITGDVHYCLLALGSYKSILTVHDTVSLDYLNHNFLKRFLVKWLWFKFPLMIADKVVCISETTKTYLEKYSKRKDFVVIYNAVDPTIQYKETAPIGPIANILCIGTSPNKNLLRTFQALKDVKCVITIIGKLSEELKLRLKELGIKYINKSNLTDAELYEEYYNCDIVSFCSLFEGFGMPVIEAHQAGCPVVCSNLPVIKEIAGDAASFCNPYDIDSIHDAFMRIISDESYRMELVKKGRENVTRFSAEIIRAQWLKLYDDLRK